MLKIGYVNSEIKKHRNISYFHGDMCMHVYITVSHFSTFPMNDFTMPTKILEYFICKNL